jgi:carbamoyl-phosphate synthase large subunit
MNMLILSVGTRNKIVQYFKKAIDGKVIASDASLLAPALYEADNYYILPLIEARDYIEIVLDICRKENISGVLSLIDPELSLLAAHRSEFANAGVTVIGSDHEICERCVDKWEMYQWLKGHGYNCARSFVDQEEFYKTMKDGELTYPIFMKPIRGSASMSIYKVYDKETVELLINHNDGLMMQDLLDGQEIGADCYVDMISGEVVSIFTKKKILMRAGETDKSVSYKDNKLFKLLEKFIKESGLRGVVDIDLFEIGGEYYISEVNPRFGGGYPHAYGCGVDIPRMIVKNIEGRINDIVIGDYEEGIYMMKYNEVMIQKQVGKHK